MPYLHKQREFCRYLQEEIFSTVAGHCWCIRRNASSCIFHFTCRLTSSIEILFTLPDAKHRYSKSVYYVSFLLLLHTKKVFRKLPCTSFPWNITENKTCSEVFRLETKNDTCAGRWKVCVGGGRNDR